MSSLRAHTMLLSTSVSVPIGSKPTKSDFKLGHFQCFLTLVDASW